jgi:hypothetical protein
MLGSYGYLVYSLYLWYKNIPTYVQEKCDPAVFNALLAKGVALAQIKQLACTVGDVVGGPTTAQTTFVTTIISLSAGIFGLYTTTGRKWDGWEPQYIPKKSMAMASEGAEMEMEPTVPTPKVRTSIEVYGNDQNTVTAPEDDAPSP